MALGAMHREAFGHLHDEARCVGEVGKFAATETPWIDGEQALNGSPRVECLKMYENLWWFDVFCLEEWKP